MCFFINKYNVKNQSTDQMLAKQGHQL